MATESLQVSELFTSIQGESTWAGLPCLFVRLAGCNLRCSYCDARYTYEEAGQAMALAAIMDWINQNPGTMVELTGGEPLQQNGIYPLMQDLLAQGRTVLLETNGSLPICAVPDDVHIIMDIKCPDSGMAEHNLAENLDVLRERQRRVCRDEIKFVLSSINDFYFARDMVVRHQLDRLLTVLFSPVKGVLPPTELADLLLRHRLNVRLQLQLHTLLWPERHRGI
ncbi:MAG: radical SAM protein [Desulfobulbus sp.]|nr:radical SAM protein [Desulfobulbus sp.]